MTAYEHRKNWYYTKIICKSHIHIIHIKLSISWTLNGFTDKFDCTTQLIIAEKNLWMLIVNKSRSCWRNKIICSFVSITHICKCNQACNIRKLMQTLSSRRKWREEKEISTFEWKQKNKKIKEKQNNYELQLWQAAKVRKVGFNSCKYKALIWL